MHIQILKRMLYAAQFLSTLPKILLITYKINQFYADKPSYTLSKEYREQKTQEDNNLIYGELSPTDFIRILLRIPSNKRYSIIDLGCGDGKLILSASLFFNKCSLMGIEIVPPLANIAIQAAEKFQPEIQNNQSHLRIKTADLCHYDIDPFDIIYINAAAFEESVWQLVEKKLLEKGKAFYVISVERKLSYKAFTLKHQGRYQTSWGMAIVRVYQKRY